MIAIVNWGNKHIVGGGESAANAIFDLLKSSGFQVSIFYAKNKVSSDDRKGGVPINVPFFYWSTTKSKNPFKKMARRFLKWGSIFLFEFMVFIKTFRSSYDNFILGESFFLAFLLSQFTRKNVFLRLHGPVKSKIFKKLVSRHVVVIANGSSYESSVRDFPLNRVVSLDPPLPDYYEQYRSLRVKAAQEKISVAYVGRLEEIKGIDLIPFYINIINKNVDVSDLYVIGEGSYEEKIGSIFEQISGITCHYVGKKSRQDAARFLASNVDFLIVPSRFDNSPNVLREALALGMKVFVSSGVHLDKKFLDDSRVIKIDNIEKEKNLLSFDSNKKSSSKSDNDRWLNLMANCCD